MSDLQMHGERTVAFGTVDSDWPHEPSTGSPESIMSHNALMENEL
jgi:hypothetical protein